VIVGWAPLILIELLLVMGAVVGWGFWELRVLRREKQRREQQAQAPAATQDT
jgi:hypothetical protein